MSAELNWNLIIVTTGNKTTCQALQKECDVLHAGNFLPAHDELLVVADPRAPQGEVGVGSGGATINAVLIAAETLSAKKDYSMIENSILEESRVLVVHAGRPPSKQWLLNPAHLAPLLKGPRQEFAYSMDSAVPAHVRQRLPWPASPLLASMWTATHLAKRCNRGLWISSVDSILMLPHVLPEPGVEEGADAVLFTVPLAILEAVQHGVVLTDSHGLVQQLIYQPSLQTCKEMSVEGRVPVISGQLYLPPAVCSRLLSLHTRHPFTHCTYHATDSGLQPFSVSLYFELIAALCCGAGGSHCRETARCSAEKYSTQHFSVHGTDMRSLARECAEKMFAGMRLKTHLLESFHFLHWPSVRTLSCEPFFASCVDKSLATSQVRSINSNIWDKHSFAGDVCSGRPICVVDSFKSQGVSVEIGEGSAALGLTLARPGVIKLGNDLLWQQCSLRNDANNATFNSIVVCFGVTDDLHAEYPSGGMFNMPWSRLERGVDGLAHRLWRQDVPKTPLNARFFSPCVDVCEQITRLTSFMWHDASLSIDDDCYSIAEAAMLCCPMEFLKLRHAEIKRYILSHVEAMMPYVGSIDVGREIKYLAYADRESLQEVFRSLHTLIVNCKSAGPVSATGWCWNSGRSATRLLAVVADVLAALAGWQGNIRTGPAANAIFNEAFQHLQEGSLVTGVQALEGASAQLCQPATAPYFASAADLTRAARHYQRAVEMLIARQILESVRSHPTPSVCLAPVAAGVWVEGTCPARLDLAGGWTDTPPVCYELGGAVLNVAILVNGKKPITVRGRWNARDACGECCRAGHGNELLGVSCLLQSGNDKYDAGVQTLSLHWSQLHDLADYHNPLSAGALVKTALIHSGIVDLNCSESLDEQLGKFGGWLELQIVSRLPSGSGLGGSSLIGGALLAVLAVLKGKAVDGPTLMHSTLGLEQRMTTGGGWQDQVGGLYGGAKLGLSNGKLPVQVDAFSVPLSNDLLGALNSRLLLLYTGQVRLAKNILQNVVRSWYTGNDSMLATFSDLIECALTAASCLTDQNIDGLASCVTRYWQLKKTVAAGSEPPRISKLFSALSPHVSGASLSGAGGGGYLYGLLKLSSSSEGMSSKLAAELSLFDVEADRVEVSKGGLSITCNGVELVNLEQPPQVLDSHKLREIKTNFELHWKTSKKPHLLQSGQTSSQHHVQ
ncbi:L-fucose kinase [Hyalella azteca]|uniref:L-fucose kinase n=1 Tax=Hyalella azteca TaxID=294128 RepID=A0A8B7P056_HYAAZ|nr:L-fucose kinase [Hyalella azteca]